MSADEEKTTKMEDKLKDITVCCICLEIYREPKILPCIHTFCLSCLEKAGAKTNKCPRDEMPCPICRQEFMTVYNGFSGLQKNFFMDRLVEIKKVLNPSVDRTLCDLCSEDGDPGGASEIPSAEVYCVDCHQKLCQECWRHHKKSKLSKFHKIIDLKDQLNRDDCIKSVSPKFCDQHKANNLEIYCYVCQMTVCAICFLEFHKAHEGIYINNVVDDFREQIRINTEHFPKYITDLVERRKIVEKDKAAFIRKTEDIEIEINSAREELKQHVDRNSEYLLLQLQSLKQVRLKESEIQKDKIETLIASLQSYETYCKHITTMGSASDICGAVNNLNKRAKELKQMYYATEKIEIYVKDISLRKADILKSDDTNTIGKIEENDLWIPAGAQSGSYESEAEFSRWIAGEACQESNEDCDETEDYIAEDLQQPTYNQTEKQLMERVSELEQQLKLMEEKEMEGELAAKRLRSYKPVPHMLMGINTKMANGCVTVTGLTILDNELYVATKKSYYIDVYDSKTYNFKRLLCTLDIGLSDPWDMCSCSRHKCLYIANGLSLFNKDQMRFHVSYAIDIDENVGGSNGKILKVDKVGSLQHSWNIGGDYGTLSITGEGNIILSVSVRGKIVEYDTNGKCLREINISTDSNLQLLFDHSNQTLSECIICLGHAVKLHNGSLLVNYFVFQKQGVLRSYYKKFSGLCMTNGEGEMIKVFPGKSGYGFMELHEPWYFAVDKDMAVLVIERVKNRISLIHPNLEYKRKLFSKKQELSNPYRMCLDEANGRLLVANSGTKGDHVLVGLYDIKTP